MRYRYLFFDLDGTLTQPEKGITKSIQYALEKLGIQENDREKLCSFIGPPLVPALCASYGLDLQTGKKALLYYRERFLKIGMYENAVYAGIPALLQALKRAGAVLLLATTKPEPQASEILRHFGLLPYFDVVAGSTLDERIAEKADVMALAISRLSAYTPNEAVMIGDRKYDVLGAKVHQIASVGVLYGYGSKAELKQAGADVIVPTVKSLHTYLLQK